MVYFRYDASSSVITSHADHMHGCMLLNVVYKGGGKVFTLTNTNTLIVSSEALKACTAVTTQ